MRYIRLVIIKLFFTGCSLYSSDSQKTLTLQECFNIYAQVDDAGYKAFAVAYDYPYFVCGISAEMAKPIYAVEVALLSCEHGRIHPQSEIGGTRAVMTRCRIYATEFVEEKKN